MKWVALGLLVAWLDDVAFAYIDPQTTTTVISGLGAIIAAIVAGWMFVWLTMKRLFGGFLAFGKRMLKSRMTHMLVGAFGILALVVGLTRFHGKQSAQLSASKRVILLGFDGLDPVLLKSYMDDGLLPSFAKLAKIGDFKPLATVSPVQSPVVWTTMATGLAPGIHEITDFIKRRNHSYVPTLSLVKQATGTIDQLRGKAFEAPVPPSLFVWERLHKEGVPVSIMRWPMTFPPSGDVPMLSGLGTPDIEGNMGNYTLLTEDAEAFNEELKGRVIPLELDDLDETEVVLPGPQVRGVMGASQSVAKFALSVDRAQGKVRIRDIEREVVLRKDELSPWLTVRFEPEGALQGSFSGILRVLVLSVEPRISLYVTPIQIDPRAPVYKVSQPATLSKEVADRTGLYHTLGMSEDTNALVDEVIDEEQFVKMAEAIMDDAEELFFDQLSRNPLGLVSFVFDTVDRVSHVFWRHVDPTHPNHDAAKAELYSAVIQRFYQKADKIVGKVLDASDPDRDTLLVVSDHGFASYRRSFHLNAWLIERGYMAVTGEGDGGTGPLFEHVDWSKTKAFALGFSQIFLNIEGRDPHGIVAPAAAELLKHELRRELLLTVDEFEDENPVETVTEALESFGAQLPYGPELVIGLKKGYRFSWQTAMGAAPPYVFEDNMKAWSGDHIIEPRHVPGIILANKKLSMDPASVYDVAPTILSLFELPIDARMRGKVLTDAPSS